MSYAKSMKAKQEEIKNRREEAIEFINQRKIVYENIEKEQAAKHKNPDGKYPGRKNRKWMNPIYQGQKKAHAQQIKQLENKMEEKNGTGISSAYDLEYFLWEFSLPIAMEIQGDGKHMAKFDQPDYKNDFCFDI